MVKLIPLLAANDIAFAIGSAAQARVICVAIDVEPVVECEFYAGLDILQCVDNDFAADDPGLAIRIA